MEHTLGNAGLDSLVVEIARNKIWDWIFFNITGIEEMMTITRK